MSVVQAIQVYIYQKPTIIITKYPGCLTVICDECHTSSADHQVCDAPMQEEQWCANVKTIRGKENFKNFYFYFAFL